MVPAIITVRSFQFTNFTKCVHSEFLIYKSIIIYLVLFFSTEVFSIFIKQIGRKLSPNYYFNYYMCFYSILYFSNTFNFYLNIVLRGIKFIPVDYYIL